MFGFIDRIVKFVRVWGKLALVVGPGIAGFLWSPFFKTFFLGFAVGATVMFGVMYSEIFGTPSNNAGPAMDPNGPACVIQRWHSTDERGYGYSTTEPCDGLQ